MDPAVIVGWMEPDDGILRDLGGRVIGWQCDDATYGLTGRHVGYFNDGLFRDNRGEVVAFIQGARGGPAKPARHARPARPAKAARPARPARAARAARAARSSTWSVFTLEQHLHA